MLVGEMLLYWGLKNYKCGQRRMEWVEAELAGSPRVMGGDGLCLACVSAPLDLYGETAGY